MTEMLTVMTEIVRDFEKIEDAEIQRVQRGLPDIKPTEKPLGTIHNEGLKKLWTLAAFYDAACQHAKLDSKYKADTDEQAADLRIRSARFSGLEDVVRALFWIQVKDEISLAAWESDSIGVRKDWMLISGSASTSGIIELLGKLTRPPE